MRRKKTRGVDHVTQSAIAAVGFGGLTQGKSQFLVFILYILGSSELLLALLSSENKYIYIYVCIVVPGYLQ